MKDRTILSNQISDFAIRLRTEERSPGTIEKYIRDVRSFTAFLDSQAVTKEALCTWKAWLISQNYAPTSINAMIAAVNRFLSFLGWEDCRIKALRLQRKLFREENRELTRVEYERLIETAQSQGRERLALLMETICSTGIRVGEVRALTVEAAQHGRAEISSKGKIRVILLPKKLCRKLLKYTKKRKITSGEIFRTRKGSSLSRKQIWAEMKSLCQKAGVAASKVFPHNLRHLFARTFYKVCRDVVKLADLLGHASIETTRMYLISTGVEHAHVLERLRLVS